MKKVFLTTLSLCVISLSANSAETGKKDQRAEKIAKVPSCKRILKECEKLSFVHGGVSDGNGLWENCFHQIIQGKSATLQGKEIKVPVKEKDITACQTAVDKLRSNIN